MRPAPFLLAPALAALVALGPFAPAAAEDAPRIIAVTGEGRVDAAPDLATLTAGVQTEARLAGEALAANSTAMQAVLAAVAAAGVAPEDVQTTQFSIDPVWGQTDAAGQPRVTGYSATNMVTVRLRDVAGLGALIDAIGTAGGNRVFGVAFALAEPRAAMDEARAEAVADARAKAELFARAAGVALGPVISIREGGFSGPSPIMARMDAAAAAPPIAEGSLEIGAQVEIVYAIE
jgi:hypothetical protein